MPIAPGKSDDASPAAGSTEAQVEAFWGAGCTSDDVVELSALRNSEATETKARAGQLILDGATLPITPGEAADTNGG